MRKLLAPLAAFTNICIAQSTPSILVLFLAAIALAFGPHAHAQDGPYKILKTARVGGEGGWDYIYADSAGRKLYIPRSAVRAVPATDTSPEIAALPPRLTVFNLDTLAPLGELAGVGGQGAVVDPKTNHGFTSDHPQVSMFDTKTLTKLKSIDVGDARPDGILFDAFNERVYVFSHPTKNATVIDARDGTVLGTIDLGGVPEEGVADGQGMLYVVMQDPVGSVTAVDVKSMKAVAHYSLQDMGGCNGLALDTKNSILFAACSRPSPSAAVTETPAKPQAAVQSQAATQSQAAMVILSAHGGQILAKLPLAGPSDGATFNPATMEAFSTGGNGTLTVVKEKTPTKFAVEQVLPTMNGARTITLDTKTGHIFTMSQERTPPPAGAAPLPNGRPPMGPPVPGSFTILMIGR
jgi:DNA-binding beta-propeller fold protein YncE